MEPQRTAASLVFDVTAFGTSNNGRTVLRRGSKACEGCRIRRVKCMGGVPCLACRDSEIAESCHVRVKARPRRPLCSRLVAALELPEAKTGTSKTVVTKSNSPLPKDTAPRRSLADVDFAVKVWCLEHEIVYSAPAFHNDGRLARLQRTPRIELNPDPGFEEQLIETFVASAFFDHLRWIDRSHLLSLHRRWRAMPNAITDDQKAFLCAALCLARSTLRNQIESVSMELGEDEASEDVMYFSLACQYLSNWKQASLCSVWALFCLVPYAMTNGGAQESRSLLEQMAQYIQELGLHREETSSLYPTSDMVDVLFSAFIYLDTFASGLLDLAPALPLRIIRKNLIPFDIMFPQCLRKVTVLEAQFLQDLHDPNVDITRPAYIASHEAEWTAQLKELRLTPDTTIPRQKRAYAELRYNWLRVLLHCSSVDLSRPSPILARTVSQILHVYADLDSIGCFSEAWPQLRQLSTSAHLLILCSATGEFHQKELDFLWNLMLGFVDRHGRRWPVAGELGDMLRRACVPLGVHIAPRDAVAGSEPREVEAMIDDQTLFTAQQGVDDFPNRSRGVCLSNETHLVNEMDPWNQIFPFDIHTGILLSMGPAAV